MDSVDRIMDAICIGFVVAIFLLNTGRVPRALELFKECLVLLNNEAVKKQKGFFNFFYERLWLNMLKGYQLIDDYANGIECCEKLLQVFNLRGDRVNVAWLTVTLAEFYKRQRNYKEAKKHYEKALAIMIETNNRKGEAFCCRNLGYLCDYFSEYEQAKDYLRKALAITHETGDKKEEALCCGNFGKVYESLGDYRKCEEYVRKALEINKEIDNKGGESACYANLGRVYESMGRFLEAEELLQRALETTQIIGDRKGEATVYSNLGCCYASLGDYNKAEEYLNKSLTMNKQVGNRRGEGSCYGSLGNVSRSVGKYDKAEKYLEKALLISREIGDRLAEAITYGNLATLYRLLSEFDKAEDNLKKSLEISREIGNMKGVAECYANLGSLKNDEEYLNKALEICKAMGDKRGEAGCYGNLGEVYMAKDYDKSEEYLNKALVILEQSEDREAEGTFYGKLGTLFHYRGEHAKAKDYHEKALRISTEIGDVRAEANWYLHLVYDDVLSAAGSSRVDLDLKHDDAFSSLLACIDKYETLRTFQGKNERLKILLSHKHLKPYQLLYHVLLFNGNYLDGLCVAELGRARALADLMSAQYSVEQQISVNPQSWVGIERIMESGGDSICLYFAYADIFVLVWALKDNKLIFFQRVDINECLVNKVSKRSFEEVFSDEMFRRFRIFPQEHCEDRSLNISNADHPTPKSTQTQQDSLSSCRLIETDEDEDQHPPSTLSECYRMLIAPAAHLLDQHEIVVVPDRTLYKVPFAALKDEDKTYLSEKYMIRVIPSLTTLRLIQDSPADYHSKTGALIVGDPDVGNVLYKGSPQKFSALPFARKEAEMIAGLVGAEPLIGEQATKQAVLQSIHSVSLIHFAAHGDAERGEIALAPQFSSVKALPQEKDYLLTMAEISKVQLRAKLVVLSCCHSAEGQIKSEGVVGIARAFLGSGARSVLVSLWALPDEETEQLMSHFYKHLVGGQSASASLQLAMKWMRRNGYSNERDWASFMLIGDNVSFDFGTKGVLP